jgi:hypothetical protein
MAHSVSFALVVESRQLRKLAPQEISNGRETSQGFSEVGRRSLLLCAGAGRAQLSGDSFAFLDRQDAINRL